MPAPLLTGFLGALDVRERSDLDGLGHLRRYKAGATLFSEGDRSDYVAVLEQGRVKVFCSTLDGHEVILAVRGTGEILGELAAITGDDEPRSATVVAMEPVHARVVSARDFLDFVASHPRVSVVLLRGLARRIRDADRRRIEFGAYDTSRRVASVLVEMISEQLAPSDEGPSKVALSQEELAGMIGASREAVARSLTGLRAQGLLLTRRRAITITDLERLHRYATS